MDDHAVSAQIRKLEERLLRIEQRLGIHGQAADAVSQPPTLQSPAPPAAAVTPPPVLRAAVPVAPATPPTQPTQPTQPTRPVSATTAASAPTSPPVSASASLPISPPATPTTTPPPSPPPVQAPPSERSTEMFLGGKTTAWVGAIIVVLGAAFAIREFGTGLWTSLPSAVQALLVAAFGGAMIASGEVVLRRLGRAASVGLFGGGLGVLYLDAFATFQWFEPPIVSQEASFILMALVAVAGFALTIHTRMLTIGVLSLVGGYLTPILLSGGQSHPLAIMAYLTMLAGIALGLSAAMPRPFRALRWLALGGQMILGLTVIVAYGSSHWMIVLIFPAIWWSMFVAESLYAAVRRQSPAGNVVSTLLASAAYVTISSWVLVWFAPAGEYWLGTFTAMIGGLSGAAALHFGPGLDTLRGRLTTAMDKLALALWVQCGVLIALAVVLHFDGYGASIGWLLLALGSIEIGRRLPSLGVSIFGLVVGTLAVLRIVVIDQLSPTLDATIASWPSITIEQWTILALAAIAALHAAAWRIGPLRTGPEAGTGMPVVLSSLAALGWLLLCVRQTEGLTMTGMWLAAAAVLIALWRVGHRQRYLDIAIAVLFITAAKWLLIDALGTRLADTWSPTQRWPLLNAQMLMAGAIAACGVWAMRAGRARALLCPPGKAASSTMLVQVALLLTSLFILIAASFEIDRAVTRLAALGEAVSWSPGHVRQLMLTLLWTLGSVAMGGLAMMVLRGKKASQPLHHDSLLLRVAWAVLIGCALKWVFADTLFWKLQAMQGAGSEMTPLGNVQMLVGVAIAGAAVALLSITSALRARICDPDGQPMPVATLAAWTPLFVSMVLLWGLTFEVDRLLGMLAATQWMDSIWSAGQLRALWWTGLWAAGGFGMLLYGRWRSARVMSVSGWIVLLLTALLWLMIDTLGWRIANGPAPTAIVFNLQFFIGAAVAVMLAWGARLLIYTKPPVIGRDVIFFGVSLIAAIVLWLGSLEIDRYFLDNPMGRQMGWSVYWMTFGVALVLIGFARNISLSRHIGLAMLALTVAKVIVVDLSTVDQVWRVTSFVVSGLLLIGTSVVYRKFASRLVAGSGPPAQG